MKLMIWGGNLALTGGDIFAFPDWKEVIRKVGQYGAQNETYIED